MVRPGAKLSGAVRVPGDKSISHRSVVLGAVAEGDTRIRGILEGHDVLATITAFRQMGVDITGPDQGRLSIRGVGLDGLSAPTDNLDLGNSGTAMRLMAGLLSGQKFGTCLVGDESLSSRPMKRITIPLTRMGACIETGVDGCPPITIQPTDRLIGIHYVLPVASAQVKSALMLAGLYADGETCVEEPAPTRDHTERMLRGFGYPCTQRDGRICVKGKGRLQGAQIEVPGDLSSAAFFIVAAAITDGSSLRLSHVGVNPTRIGLLEILREMGASIKVEQARDACGEPVADLQVKAAPLRGIEVPVELVSSAIDEFPILCIAAACADGVTVVRGAGELRHKESDRISAMVTGLRTLGIDVEEFPDGMSIRGGSIQGGSVASHGDHRVAMAFCIAGNRARSSVEVQDCANIATSFPNFLEVAATCGMHIDVVN